AGKASTKLFGGARSLLRGMSAPVIGAGPLQGGPKLSWQTWAFADIMADAYMKKRTSEIPDLVALAASAAFVSKALGALSQVSQSPIQRQLHRVLEEFPRGCGRQSGVSHVPQRLGAEDQGARRGGPRDGAVRVGPGRRHGSFRDFRRDEAGRRGVFRFDRQPARGGDGVPRP
ncbi:unnamed protein product, partial [Ectocarpus sp. 13 AM-2016]